MESNFTLAAEIILVRFSQVRKIRSWGRREARVRRTEVLAILRHISTQKSNIQPRHSYWLLGTNEYVSQRKMLKSASTNHNIDETNFTPWPGTDK